MGTPFQDLKREYRTLEAFTKYLVHEIEFIAIVEPKSELIKIKWQILLGDFMKHPHDSSLEKRPYVFDSVGVNVPRCNISLGVIDRFVGKFGAIQPQIRRKLVC